MRKLHILIPSLVATTAMPLISLSGCNSSSSEQTKLVQFDTNGGSFVKTLKVTVGEIINQPENPSKTGFSFGGWYDEEEFITQHNFSQPVKDDITIYAKWNNNPSDINLNKNRLTLEVGQTEKLVAIVSPHEASQEVSWETDYTGTVTVGEDGTVTAIKAGTSPAPIKASVPGRTDLYDVCYVTVKPAPTPTQYNTYLCNNASDGYTISQNTFKSGDLKIGVITSQYYDMDENHIEKVMMNGVEIPSENYHLDVEQENAYIASLYLNEGFEVSGDISIWLKTTGASAVIWNYPEQVDPPKIIFPATGDLPVPPLDSVRDFYFDWATDDKYNLVNEFMTDDWRHLIPSRSFIESNIYPINVIRDGNYLKSSYRIKLKWFMFDSEGGYLLNMDLKVENVKSYITYQEGYGLGAYWLIWSALNELSTSSARREFLISEKDWSIEGSYEEMGNSCPMISLKNIKYDWEYVNSLSDEEWEEQEYNITRVYELSVLNHISTYLENIVWN